MLAIMLTATTTATTLPFPPPRYDELRDLFEKCDVYPAVRGAAAPAVTCVERPSRRCQPLLERRTTTTRTTRLHHRCDIRLREEQLYSLCRSMDVDGDGDVRTAIVAERARARITAVTTRSATTGSDAARSLSDACARAVARYHCLGPR